MRTSYSFILAISLVVLFSQCNNNSDQSAVAADSTAAAKPVKTPRKRTAPDSMGFHKERTKAWIANNKGNADFDKVLAINRTDSAGIKQLDSIVVPADLSGDIEFYLPFPVQVNALQDVEKILIFSYPAQAFAAYEYGELVYTGATNMGRKKDTTPTGLFYCNWKAEKTISTFNDEWELKWNFNIESKLGIGFHQYALPGYPASHSCLRLTAKDAKYLYNWAQQWVLDPSNENIELAKGTPVLVYGSYPFGSQKPWLKLVSNARALDISAQQLETELQPLLPAIIAEQQKRVSVLAAGADTLTRK